MDRSNESICNVKLGVLTLMSGVSMTVCLLVVLVLTH